MKHRLSPLLTPSVIPASEAFINRHRRQSTTANTTTIKGGRK